VLTWVYFKIEVFDPFHKKYDGLPQKVPIEFDIKGKVVRTQNKEFLYAFPGIGTIAYILFTILSFVPHRFRYVTIVNEGIDNL
jgi:hypothetical protein